MVSCLSFELPFFLKCYAIGAIGNLAMGPIFMLTIKRSAQRGFLHGIATAISAAIADGALFFLGLFGVLSLFDESVYMQLAMFALGGSVLLYLGVRSFHEKNIDSVSSSRQETIAGIIVKTFLFTLINPGTLLYFMGASVSVIDQVACGALHQSLLGALMVCIGTLSVLATVTCVATRLGVMVAKKQLHIISRMTGVLLIIFAIFCYYRLIKTLSLLILS